MLTKINDKSSFGNIYRMKNYEGLTNEITQNVYKYYNILKKEEMAIFTGNNPLRTILDVKINNICKLYKEIPSKLWLRSNAENYGITWENDTDNVLYIFSTQKDIDRLNNYIPKRINRFSGFLGFFRQIKLGFEEASYDLPEYLRKLKTAVKLNNDEDVAFKNFAGDIIDVDNTEHLLSKLLKE